MAEAFDGVLRRSFDPQAFVGPVRLTVLSLGAVALAEFGRRALVAAGPVRPGPRATLALLAGAAALAAFAGSGAAEDVAHGVIEGAGALAGAVALFRHARESAHAANRKALRVTALALAGHAFMSAVMVLRVAGSAGSTAPDVSPAGVPPVLVRAVLAMLFVVGLSGCLSAAMDDAGSRRWRVWKLGGRFATAVLVIGLGIGWLVTDRLGRDSDRHARTELLRVVRSAAMAIDPALIAALDGRPEDMDRPEYASLRGSMRAICEAGSECRFSYVMVQRDGRFVFLVDSEDEDSKDHSHPGDEYTEASPELRALFADHESGLVEGPLEDRWGTWVSALVPVRERMTDRVVGVLGIDVPAGTWTRDVAFHRLLGILGASAFALVVAAFGAILAISRTTAAAIANSEARFRALFEHSPEPLVLFADGRCTLANPAAVALFGGDAAAMTDRPQTAFLPEGNTFPPDAEPGTSTAMRGACHAFDGRAFESEVTATALARGVNLVIVRDVSEQRAAEEALMAAHERALVAVRAKSEFIANTSHELRTPLNGILGMTHLLLDGQPAPEQRESLEMIQQCGESLLSIVNDILDFSKMEAGRLELDAAPLDLRELAESVVEVVAPRAFEKGVEIVALCPAGNTRVIGDAGRLRQVLLNFAANAVKFTEEGEVVVSVACAPSANGTARFTFTVEDTGIGVPLEAHDRLFHAFSQVDASMTRRFGGTGLGLAICRQIVDLMHGRIGFESEPGVGSRFWFELDLPLDPDAPAGAEPLDGCTVVVGPMSAPLRRGLESQLAACGARAVHAASIDHVRTLLGEAAGAVPYSAVVCDLGAPLGEAFARAAGALPGHPPRIGIRAAGVFAESVHPPACEERIAKPVRTRALHDALAGITSRAAGAATQRAAPRGPSRSILVVEDNPVNQRVASRMLERAGHRVVLAGNGVEGLEQLARDAFDLVLTDVQMPVMDGYAFVAELRRRYGRALPVVAMTAHALDGDRDRCLAAGMDDYVSKPVRPAELLGAVERWSAAPAGS